MKRMTSPAAGDLLQDRLQPLFEFAAVFGAGEQRAEIERQQAPALEGLRYVTLDDALRQSLDDRGLSDARLRRSGQDYSWCGARAPGSVRRISSSRPMTGSSLFCRASSVKSRVYFLSAS